MDDILAKKNRHLFLEEKDNQNNSFIGNINDVANRKEELDTVAAHITNVDTVGDHINNVDTVANNISDINDAVDNIATVKTFNDNVNNGTMQYLLEAFTTSLNEQGNAWEVRLTQLGESILATTSAFNYSTVATISSDIPANGTLILPNSMKYKVGTHMLMVSWNGTVCYAGEQYDEVGAYGVWATSIKLNQPAKTGDKIQLRIVALTDQSSYVDITETAINASQFVASGSNTERYLPEFLGDVVNVKNFGAIGNGVNDDTTAFQSAIASGKAVFVPEGTYKLNTDLSGIFCGIGNSIFTGGTVNSSTILRGVAQKNNDIINVKDFGAKGDGVTDDRVAISTVMQLGKKVFFPAGTYLMKSADADNAIVNVTSDKNIDVICDQNATIKIDSSLSSLQGSLFRCESTSGPSIEDRVSFSWIGGRFDASDLTIENENGIALIDIYFYSGFAVRDVDFFCGDVNFPSEGDTNVNLNDNTMYCWGVCDTGIVCHNCFGGLIDNCSFIGFYDTAIYISGNYSSEIYDGIGEAQVVSNCQFRRCSNAIVMKRNHIGQTMTNNFIYECGNGIFSGTTGTPGDLGQTSIIMGNRLKRIRSVPISLGTGRDYVVSGNTIVDFGKEFYDSSINTPVSSWNNKAGILLSGCSNAIISNNMIAEKDWAGGTVNNNKAIYGIRLGTIAVDSSMVVCRKCVVSNNLIEGTQAFFQENSACYSNYINENIYIEPSSGSSYRASSSESSAFIGQSYKIQKTIAVPELASGTSYFFDITDDNINRGDLVCGIGVTKDTFGLEITAYIQENGLVYVRVHNSLSESKNIGVATYTIWLKQHN